MKRIGMGLAALALAAAACGQGTNEAKAGDDGPKPVAKAAPATAAIQAGPATPSETREFRDWMAVCDNGNACYAFGFEPDDAGWLRISMDPGPDAGPEIAFGLWAEDFVQSAAGGAPPPSLVVDGRAFGGTVGSASSDGVPVAEIKAGARAAITAIASGQSMEIRAGAGAAAAISTSGASAALLWIDERQGRLGTTTALLRRGDRPASSVPAPPALPVVRPAPAVDQAGFGDDKQTLPMALKALPAVQNCLAESEHSDWLLTNVMSARLDARTELWAVPCGAGAYNVSHQWFLTGPGGRDPRPADLFGSGGPRTGDEAGGWPDNSTVNGGYAADARSIVAFAKGRGLSDCGAAQTWVWTGRQFTLSQEISMGNCAGVPADYWPTTWRSVD